MRLLRHHLCTWCPEDDRTSKWPRCWISPPLAGLRCFPVRSWTAVGPWLPLSVHQTEFKARQLSAGGSETTYSAAKTLAQVRSVLNGNRCHGVHDRKEKPETPRSALGDYAASSFTHRRKPDADRWRV